ncbi:CHAP domain-containing protein [bacterium]|nr:CHAP domain-containing protein [bacterium]
MEFDKIKTGYKEFLKNKGTGDESTKNVDNFENVNAFDDIDSFEDYIGSKTDFVIDDAKKDIEEVEGLQFKDDKIVNEDGSTDVVVDALNELISNDKLKETLDKSGDGTIDISEIKDFCKEVSGADEDDTNISLKDIIQSAKDFIAKLGETEETSDVEEDIESDIQNEEITSKPTSSPSSAGGASGAGGAGGASGAGRGSGTGGTGGASNPADKSIEDNMSVEQIEQEISTTQGELDGYQAELAAINDGSDSEIASLEKAEQEAYEEYQKQMGESAGLMDGVKGFFGGATPEKINDKKGEVDSKQNEIDSKASEISSQESAVASAESALANATSNKENLEALVGALEASDSEESAEKLAGARQELEAAIQAEKEASDKLQAEEDKLGDLNEEKTNLEAELETLNGELKDLQDEFEKDHPEVKDARQAWEQAKADVEAKKAEKTKDVEAKIQASEDKLKELNTQLQDAKNAENAKKYTPNDLGDDIVEFAEKFLGYNEGDNSADEFMKGMDSASIPWCAAYVEYIMENNASADKLPDWYTSIQNQWYCPNIYAAASQNNAIISGGEAQKGDIVLFDWENNGGDKDHIGIFCGIENSKAVVIEGNTSNQVAKRYYDLNDSRLTYCSIRK